VPKGKDHLLANNTYEYALQHGAPAFSQHDESGYEYTGTQTHLLCFVELFATHNLAQLRQRASIIPQDIGQ
jgi:hypothetical protein